jgi:hypothetical protein
VTYEEHDMNVSGSDEEEENVPRRARTWIHAPGADSSAASDPLLNMNRTSRSSPDDIDYFFLRHKKERKKTKNDTVETNTDSICIHCR